MVYKSLTDMLLDNREGLRRELKSKKASAEMIEAALNSFDWVSCECLRKNALLDVYREKFGEVTDPEALHRIIEADKEYVLSAMHNEYPKSGYSAAESDR